MCQREFALKHMPDDELFQVVETMFQVMPDILTRNTVANPTPTSIRSFRCVLVALRFDAVPITRSSLVAVSRR
jgi:hypothetical protein